MTEPVIIDSSLQGGPGGWTRSRVIFLAVSAAVVVALLWWAREVLLPFVLALIIAYVLTPLVERCERARIPRSVSILLVYAVTLSLIYLSIATIAPRIYSETAKLVREAPALARGLGQKWGPRVEDWVQGLIDRTEQRPPAADPAPQPAFTILKRPDGSMAVELGSGVHVVQEDAGRWRITAVQPPTPARFKVSEVTNEGIERFFEYVKANSLEVIRLGQVLVSKVSRTIFLLFMTLMVAGYLMHTRDKIMDFFRSLPPARVRPSFDRLLHRIDRGLAGVVRGQLLICLVNGVLSAIGFWMFGLKYWVILAIVAAIMSLIPIFGSILSSIPAVVIGLTQDFWTALWVLLWIIGIHQVEANLLNPKIIGVAAKIHPVLVVLALLTGEHFYGLWGALFAVPALSILQSVFNHFRFESMPDAGPDSLLPPATVSRVPRP
jgi:predicted PurR-regulated permease PerM